MPRWTPNIQAMHIEEKGQIKDFNKKFASFIDKVQFLEQQRPSGESCSSRRRPSLPGATHLKAPSETSGHSWTQGQGKLGLVEDFKNK